MPNREGLSMMNKHKLFLASLCMTGMLMTTSPAHAGYPIFDVSKTASLIVGLVGRFQPIKEKLDSIKEVKDMYDTIKAKGLAGMLGNISGLGQKLSGKLSGLKGINNSRIPHEEAAKNDGTLNDITKAFTDYYFIKTGNIATTDEANTIKERRNVLKDKITRSVMVQALHYAYSSNDDLANWSEQINKAMDNAKTDQDAINANTTVTMAANFERMKLISLTVSKMQKDAFSKLLTAPEGQYRLPPEPTIEELQQCKKDELDVDLH